MNKKNLNTQKLLTYRRTTLSLLTSAFCCIAAPTLAANCTTENNSDGGVNMICSGTNNSFVTALMEEMNNNVITVTGEDTVVPGEVYGGVKTQGEISGNKVILNDNSKVERNIYGGIIGFYGSAIGNSVTLNDRSSTQNIYGGKAIAGIAENNTVTLNDRTSAIYIYGGYGEYAADTKGNTVTLNGSSTAEAVIGGYSQNGGSAEGNTINLNDNSYTETAYASQIDSSTEATSKNNTVNINGNITSIYMAGAIGNFNRETVSGNTLNFNNKPSTLVKSKLTATNLNNFDAYNVYLSGNFADYFSATDALITVTGSFGNSYTTKADFTVKNSHITLTDASQFKVGEQFIILNTKGATYTQGGKLSDNINLINEGINTVAIGLIYSLDVELGINDEEGSVYVLIDEGNGESGNSGSGGGSGGGNSGGSGATGQFKVDENAIDRLSPVLDSQVATMTILNQGNTLSNSVLIGIEPTKKGEVITFGQMSSGHTKTKGTSDININGLNLLVGAGYNLSDKTIIGGYFEYGYGHYNSTRNFSGYSNGTSNFSALHYNGSGHVNYEGVGVLGKHYFAGFNDSLYIDGGLKVGSISTNYSSTSFTDAHYRPSNMDFSNSHVYFGGSVGGGYLWKMDNKQTLNSSLNFIYSQFKGDDITLDSTVISMDKMKSERFRLDETYLYQLNELTAVNLSAAFDYELNDKATGTVDGYEMTTSSLKGGTGSVSAGVRLTPFNHADKDKYIEVNVYGSQGKVDSVGGNISFNYNF